MLQPLVSFSSSLWLNFKVQLYFPQSLLWLCHPHRTAKFHWLNFVRSNLKIHSTDFSSYLEFLYFGCLCYIETVTLSSFSVNNNQMKGISEKSLLAFYLSWLCQGGKKILMKSSLYYYVPVISLVSNSLSIWLIS